MAGVRQRYEDAFTNAPGYEDKPKDWLESRWKGFKKRCGRRRSRSLRQQQPTLANSRRRRRQPPPPTAA